MATLVAWRPEEVLPVLAAAEAATRDGLWAAGFLAYEAAAGLDPALTVLPPAPGLPLAWFAVAPRAKASAAEHEARPAPPPLAWEPSMDAEEHARRVARVRAAIARGDTYQVNLTWRLRAPLDGDAGALFAAMLAAQPVAHAAWIDTGEHVVACASPELFLARRGELLLCRPMKGTTERGRFPAEDAERRAALGASAKERAENLMVTDMVRNDLARVADAGSVHVARLFEAERYATLWQLTSSVVARSAAPLVEVLRALFPSASITGAPKASTMRLIAALEGEPRGVYTGAVGWMGPGRRARFAVAIRTVWIDRARGVAEYGTGGGVTWGSSAAREHAEGQLKARVLVAGAGPSALLETLRWTPGRGYWLLREHLERLRASAAHLGFAGSGGAADALQGATEGFDARPQRVRLLLSRRGDLEVQAEPFRPRPRPRWRVALAAQPVDRRDARLFHKTADRARYEAMRAARPGCDDVLLWNAQGELTESTVANLVVRLDGELRTPALDAGLLPGTLRARLLARGIVREAVVPVEALRRATGVWLVNGLRGWLPVTVVES